MYKNKNDFIKNIGDGKWFRKGSFLVKFKQINNNLIGLWLSNFDTEGMCFTDQDNKEWDIIDNKFIEYGAGVYHFGNGDVDENSIYDEETCELLVDKMKEIILNSWENNNYKLISKEELDDIWSNLESNNVNQYEILV